MQDSEDNFVTLATFTFVSEALALVSKLEDEEIPHMMPEYHTSSIAPFYTGMQVRVLVRQKDLERAREFLPDPATKASAATPGTFWSNLGLFLLGLITSAPMRRKIPPPRKGE